MRTFIVTEPKRLRDVMAMAWETAKASVIGGPLEIIIQRPSKSREQERKYHAMIGDIAATVELNGNTFSRDAWKALLVDGFEQELNANGEKLRHPSESVISLDGRRFVTIRASTKRFIKTEAAQFIEYLYHYGSECGATFSDKSLSYYEEIAEMSAA